MAEPLKLGTKVKGYGEVIAVGWFGERYYWLSNRRGDVSMMPATLIEPLANGGNSVTGSARRG